MNDNNKGDATKTADHHSVEAIAAAAACRLDEKVSTINAFLAAWDDEKLSDHDKKSALRDVRRTLIDVIVGLESIGEP